MDNERMAKEPSLKNVLDGFLESYVKRDKSIAFSDWLEDKLLQEMPDMSKEAAGKLAGEIIGGVYAYDERLEELNTAVDAGQPKEEWLAEQVEEEYADMPIADAGERLQQAERELAAANARRMGEGGNTQPEEENPADSGVEWNRYNVKDKVRQIGKQAVLSGMAAAANVIKDRMQGGSSENTNMDSTDQEALRDAVKNEPKEVKATVAGAVRVAAEQGLTDISDDGICDMAGVAVESAGALYAVASGEITVIEGVEKVGRACVAAGCHFCQKALKGIISCTPFDSLLEGPLGEQLDKMGTPEFAENAYTVVRNTAVKVWEGVKGTVKGVLKKGAKLFKGLFS